MKTVFLSIIAAFSALTAHASSLSDTAIKEQISTAIVGLQSGGGEGEPTPYKMVEVDADTSTVMTDELLLKQLLPQLEGTSPEQGIPGIEEGGFSFENLTKAPVRSEYESDGEYAQAVKEAKQWKAVKAIFTQNLVQVKFVDMGYRYSENSSLETGAVAHVILGRTETGLIIAIYAIDIWT